MTADEIAALIDQSAEATEAVAEYAAIFDEERRVNNCDRYDNGGTNEAVTALITSYLANAIRWKQDRWGHVSHAPLPGDEWFLPSQIRIKVITELQHLSDFLPGPDDIRRTRRRISISMYAVDALRKGAALGPTLLFHLQRADLDEQLAQHRNDLGLGGIGEHRIEAGSVFGYSDPAVLTGDMRTKVRLIKRMEAAPDAAGAMKLIRAHPVLWELSPVVVDVLARANRCRRGRHINILDVRRRLDAEGMENLLSCARQAARLLEIAFHITDRMKSNQSNETIESWLHPTPLSRFIVGVFETFSPTLSVPFNEIRLARNIPRTKREMEDEEHFDPLTKSSWDLASEGYDCAQKIINIIPDLRGTELDIGAALMEDTEEEQKKIKLIREAAGREETAEDIQGRLQSGRDDLIADLWALRHDMLTLRGYTDFLGWYHGALIDKLPDPVWISFQLQIFNEIQDWYRELRARYEEGIVRKREIRRHAGGQPLDILELRDNVQRHTIKVIEYPRNGGFGAKFEDEIMQSLLQSIAAKHPDVFNIWRQATAELAPIPA